MTQRKSSLSLIRRLGHVLFCWLPPLLVMAGIYILSDQPDLPSLPGPWWDTAMKKVAHALGYAMLTALLVRALRRGSPLESAAGARMWAGTMALFYAASDEFHQRFVPGRNGTVADVLVDGVGILLAMSLHWRLVRHREAAHRSAE
jgi:VanZ family protein